MSEEKTNNNLTLMTDDADPRESAKEQARLIAKMCEDRDKKAQGAKERLVERINVLSEKCLTANGVIGALHIIRNVFDKSVPNVNTQIEMACNTVKRASGVAKAMARKATLLEPEEMDKLCDGFYSKAFAKRDVDTSELVDELMTLDLCQTIGPNAEDVAEFCKTADEEVERARESLRTFCSENGIDFDELCDPHDEHPDCLCDSCSEDCKEESRTIRVGQSAYDVCESFRPIEE